MRSFRSEERDTRSRNGAKASQSFRTLVNGKPRKVLPLNTAVHFEPMRFVLWILRLFLWVLKYPWNNSFRLSKGRTKCTTKRCKWSVNTNTTQPLKLNATYGKWRQQNPVTKPTRSDSWNSLWIIFNTHSTSANIASSFVFLFTVFPSFSLHLSLVK